MDKLVTLTQEYSSINEWLEALHEFQFDNLFPTSVLGRAYDFINNIEIIVHTNSLLKAKVDSIANCYEIVVEKDKNTILTSCSCKYEGPCKHTAALLLKLKNIKF